MSKQKIPFNQFIEIEKSLEIKYGEILSVHEIPKSKKLRLLKVDFGDNDIRNVVTNMISNALDEKQNDPTSCNIGSMFVTNLEPAVMMGVESTAMILPLIYDDGVIWPSHIIPGTKLL